VHNKPNEEKKGGHVSVSITTQNRTETHD